jgi:cephalosporin hydroxylase
MMLEKHLKPSSERKFSGVYTDSDTAVLMNYGRVGGNKYKNRQIMHEPMFLNAMRVLIDHERPLYVMEFGTFDGGLSEYMSDIAKNIKHDIKIISYDIDFSRNVIQEPISDVELVQLDIFDIKNYLTVNHNMIANLEGPKFIIDDVGINTIELLEAIDPYLKKGDHFICCHTLNKNTHDGILNYIGDSYSVNTYACDMFGENFIENPNGFLVKN